MNPEFIRLTCYITIVPYSTVCVDAVNRNHADISTAGQLGHRAPTHTHTPTGHFSSLRESGPDSEGPRGLNSSELIEAKQTERVVSV